MNSRQMRGFPVFWAGRTASQFGDQITLLAMPWLLADATASPLAVGLLEAVAFAPMLLFGLPIGAMADRRSRRTSMIQADLLRLAVILTIPLAVLVLDIGVNLAHVLIAVFVVGIGTAVFEASAQAFLTDLVPGEQIVQANARLSFTEGLAEVAGPAAAGILIAWLGASGALVFDAVTFGLSALALVAMLRVRERYVRASASLRHAIGDGVRVMWQNRRLRTLTLVIGGSNLGSGMVAGLIVLFLQRSIHLEGWEAGLVYAANGAGGICASFVAPRIIARRGISRSIPVGLIVAATGFTLVAVTPRSNWVTTAPLGMFLIGLGVVSSFIASASLRQRTVATEFLGRVTTSYRTIVNGAVALGAVVGGVVGEFVGVRPAMLAGAGVYFAVTVVSFFSPLNAPDGFPPSGSET